MPPMSFASRSDIVDQVVQPERDQEMERKSTTSHRRRHPTAPAEELELELRSAEGSCHIRFRSNLQPPTSLLHTTCTYKRVPSLPIPASMHEALILAKRWKVGCFLRLLIIPAKTQRSSGSGWPSSIMPSSGVQRQYYAVRNNSGEMVIVPRTTSSHRCCIWLPPSCVLAD